MTGPDRTPFDVDQQWRAWNGDEKKLRQVMRITVRRLEKTISDQDATFTQMVADMEKLEAEVERCGEELTKAGEQAYDLKLQVVELKAANDRMERNCHRYAGELNYRENWLSPSQVVHLLDAERRSMED